MQVAPKVPWWHQNSATIFRLVRQCIGLMTSWLCIFKARSILRAFVVPKLILLFTAEGLSAQRYSNNFECHFTLTFKLQSWISKYNSKFHNKQEMETSNGTHTELKHFQILKILCNAKFLKNFWVARSNNRKFAQITIYSHSDFCWQE